MKNAVQLFNDKFDCYDKATGVSCISLGYFQKALTEHDKEIIQVIDEMIEREKDELNSEEGKQVRGICKIIIHRFRELRSKI